MDLVEHIAIVTDHTADDLGDSTNDKTFVRIY
jgi:hypothetical protein